MTAEARVTVELLATSAAGGSVGRIAGTDQLVLAGPSDPCGECDVCRRGGAAACPSRQPAGPARTARYLLPLADGLALPLPAAAAVAGEVALAYTLYARTGPGPRDPVVLVGASPVIRFLVEILRAKGISPVVVAEPNATGWCAWLASKGAALAHDAAGVTAAIATQGSTARAPRVIAVAELDRAVELTGPRSTLTVLAGPDARLSPAHLSLVFAREVTVISVAGPHPDLVVEVAAMCTKGEIDLVGGTALASTDDHRAIVQPR